MNVKATLLAFVFAVAASAGATEFSHFFQDPLLTRPPNLDSDTATLGQNKSELCALASLDGINQAMPLTLEKAIDIALCHNPQIKGGWADIKIRAALLGEARASYLPSLGVSTGKLRSINKYPDGELPNTENVRNLSQINLTWRLYDFGVRSGNLESAKYMLASTLSAHEAILQRTMGAVIGAYFDAMLAQARVATAAQTVAFTASLLQTTQRREAAGVVAVTETLEGQAALAKALLAKSRADGELRSTRSVLVSAMGLTSAVPLYIAQEQVIPKDVSVLNLERWMEQARQKHPSIVAVRDELAAAQAKLESVIAEGLPTLELSHNYYQNGFPNQGAATSNSKVRSTGITLSAPVFDGFSRTYKIRGAQAQVEQTQNKLQDAETRVMGEIMQAHAEAQSAFDNLGASEVVLRAVESVLQSANNRYNRGAADLFELLSAQKDLGEAQFERVNSLVVWRSARLKLLATAAVLDKSLLDEGAPR
jgi:outer membrane protein